ncbi:glycosyltransferase family 32 protein [Bacteroidota bacterium]
MPIPKIIHQTWKDEKIPVKWQDFQQKVISLHSKWEYKLWTDKDIDDFVSTEFQDFYSTFSGFEKHIMRVDVVRYLILYKIGGLYLDLDYEMVKLFDLIDHELILPKNRGVEFGDDKDVIGNSVLASAPGHNFWKIIINDLSVNPPKIRDYFDVEEATGPHFLTRIYNANKNKIENCIILDRKYFHHPIPKQKSDYFKIVKNKDVYGFHHTSGSWRERFTLPYFKNKIRKLFQ